MERSQAGCFGSFIPENLYGSITGVTGRGKEREGEREREREIYIYIYMYRGRYRNIRRYVEIYRV